MSAGCGVQSVEWGHLLFPVLHSAPRNVRSALSTGGRVGQRRVTLKHPNRLRAVLARGLNSLVLLSRRHDICECSVQFTTVPNSGSPPT